RCTFAINEERAMTVNQACAPIAPQCTARWTISIEVWEVDRCGKNDVGFWLGQPAAEKVFDQGLRETQLRAQGQSESQQAVGEFRRGTGSNLLGIFVSVQQRSRGSVFKTF